MVLCCALLLLAQDARDLVEKLRSDRIEEREDAARRLKEIGKAAVPELEKAARDADAEVAGRARNLLAAIGLRETLSPRLLKAKPGLEDRLASGDDHAWTLALIDGAQLPPRDLEPLVPRAIRGAETPAERSRVCDILGDRKLHSGAAALASYLVDGDGDVQHRVLWAYGTLHSEEAVAALLPLLDNYRPVVRGAAAAALGRLGVRASLPQILRVLSDPEREARAQALQAIRDLGARDAAPAVLKLAASDRESSALDVLVHLQARSATPLPREWLGHENSFLRAHAAEALGRLRDHDSAPAIVRLLKNPEPYVRQSALEALAMLDARESAASVEDLLKDPDPVVQRAAIKSLSQLRPRGAARAIAPFLENPDRDTVNAALAALTSQEDRKDLEVALPALLRLGRVDEFSLSQVLARLPPERVTPALEDRIRKSSESWRYDLESLKALPGRARVDALVRLIDHPEAEVRSTVAHALTALHVRSAVPEIRRRLRDRDPEVASNAAQSLALFDDRESIPDIRALLKTGQPAIPLCLADLGDRQAIPEILRCLESGDASLRVTAADALARLGVKESSPDVVKLLDRPEVRNFILIQALGRLGGPEVAAALRGLLLDSPAENRREALRPALDLGAVADVERLLEDEDLTVRTAAIRALCNADSRASLPLLRKRLGDPADAVRIAALDALVVFQDRGEAQAIIARLGDRAPGVREAAARAVRDLRLKEAAGDLRKGLRFVDPSVEDVLLGALVEIDAREAVPDLLRLLQEGSLQSPWMASQALADLSGREAVPDLLRDLGSDAGYRRENAAIALGRLRAESAVKPLTALLRDPLPEVRAAALDALDLLGEDPAAFRPLLKDAEARVRWVAAEALARRGDPAALPALRALLREGPWWVPFWSLSTLEEFRLRDALPDILPLLEHPESSLRRSAAQALGRLGGKEAVPALRAFLTDVEGLAAAEALCELGEREGVSRMLVRDQYNSLRTLNVLRSPEAWKKLGESRVAEDLAGTAQELVETLAGRAGFKVEWPAPRAGMDRVWRFRRHRVHPSTSVLDFAWLIPHGFEFILETGRIRILPREEARLFWVAWSR